MKAACRRFLANAAGVLLAGGPLAAEPLPQEQVSFAAAGAGRWTIEWAGVAGRIYFVQCSRDLVNWSYCPVIRHGPGVQQCEVETAATAGFYVRLKYPNEDRFESLEEARTSDLDGDGIPSWREVEELGADPFDRASVGPDGDGDGMPDWWETAQGFDLGNPGDATGDPDHDELSNAGEFAARTNPRYFDTDGDRFSDGFEAGRAGFDPLLASTGGDADGDGLADLAELSNGTNPGAADSDGDGVWDGVELSQASDPLDPLRRPFDPAAHFGPAAVAAAVQPMGNLGVNYSPGLQHKISVSLRDDLRWFGPPPGIYATEQEAWRLVIDDDQHVDTDPRPIPFGGGYYAPFQTIGAELQLDGSKNHRLTLQHLGLAGTASPEIDDSPLADFRHSLYVTCPGFLVLTNQPAIPPLDYIYQATGALGYDWKTRVNYLIPLASNAYSASYSGGDATGPRFRRVSPFGRPLPEFTPEQEAEGDQSSEESHIDAFDLSLRHDTSFASIPLAASELRLEAAASTRESTWSNRGGLRPAEDLTSPFGIAWSSNLCAYIEVVETIGHSTTRPATVNVVDEGGRGQRFGSTDGLATFFSWPSGVVDKKSSLNELRREGDTLVMRKKFGNTLTYRPCDSWFTYSSDRLEATDSVRRHRYWRLEEVVDRFGQKVVYDYGGSSYSLIPAEIRAQGRPGQRLRITRSLNGRRVTAIEDALGNFTDFHYVDKSIAVGGATFQFAYQELGRVTFPGGSEEHYGYEVVTDPESVNGKVTHHFHANLASLRRGSGAQRVFHYAFDRSRKWRDSSLGRIAIRATEGLPDDIRQRAKDYVASVNSQPQAGSVLRVQYGVPRRIARVEWPALGLQSTFAKSAETKTVFGPQFEAVSVTEITDTAGKRYRYDFTGVLGEIVDTDTTTVGGTTSVSTDWLIRYPQMTLSYLDGAGLVLGSERFEFDPAAGLGLKRVVDFSGNETRWDFGETRPPGARLLLKNDPGFLSKWPDPTAKTDALGRIERYEYGPLRILSESIDVHGTVTEYGVDALGRRVSMIVTDAAGTRLLEESYAYGNPAFPGFMTRKTRVAFADRTGKSWEQDLVTEYHADPLGRLAREVVDPGGLNLETHHSHDLNGRKSETRDPNGNLTSFEYDAKNRLVKVTHADASIRRTDHDANNLKIREVDENGHVTLFERDSLGRLTATVRDLDGDGLAGVGDPVTRVAYDAAGSVRKLVDPRGFATVTFHDDLHRPVQVFQGVPAAAADGNLAALSALAAGSREIARTEFAYEMDANPGGGLLSPFKPTRTIRHNAVSVDRGLADVTLTATADFDAIYRQVGESTEYLPGSSRTSAVNFGTIHAAGHESLVSSATDALGKSTRTTRDGMGREIEVIDGDGLTDPALVHTSAMAYSSTGLAWSVIDPLGRHSETGYDTAGRPVKKWQPDPVSGLVSNDSPLTETILDANGNAVAVIDPLGRRTDFDFDNRNRKWRTRAPAVTDAANPDAPLAGVRPVTSTAFDAVGNAIAVTDPRGATVRTFHDRANRPILTRSNPVTGNPSSSIAVAGAHDITSTTVLDSGGLALAMTDGNGNITRNAYDGLGRLVATACDPTDGDPVDPAAPGFDAADYRVSGPTAALVTNVHDDAGNIIEVTDGKGQRTAFSHDGFARKIRTIRDPETAVEQVDAMAFNALYQIRRTDAKGVVTLYLHDLRHRLTEVVHAPEGAAVTSTHPDNRRIHHDPADRVLAVTFPNEADSLRATASTYDHLDRLTSETSAGVTHLYPAYDPVGNRLRVTYGRSGTTLVCLYDALNRLLECEERSDATVPSGRVTRYAYDSGGKVTRKTLPNGSSSTSSFDLLGRTLSIVEKNGLGAVLSSFDYSAPVDGWPGSHDAAGNVLRCAETYSRAGMVDRVVVNHYDRCHRLTSETITPASAAATVTGYGYDLANNRETRSVDAAVTRYVFGNGMNGANANQLVAYGPDGQPATHEFTYDANGNRSSRTTATGPETYAWDHENRLTGLTLPAGRYRYGYDSRSRRVLRDESLAGGAKVLLSFSGGLSVQEADPAGVVQAEIIRGSDWGGGTGGVLYSIRGGQRSYNAYNSRGDVVSTSDDSGAATWQGAYEAFGTRSAEQGTNTGRQRANTKEEDPTGLLNEGFRYRDLAAGVFISRDPAGFVDGPNVYTYVRQNPWTYFDPEGLFMQYFGDWAAATFGAPPAPVCFMAKHSGKVTGTVHAINGAVSFVPGLGKIADGLDATISAAEGDYAGAALTAGGGKIGELSVKAFKIASAAVLLRQVANHADEAADAGRTLANSVDEVVDQAKTARSVGREAAGTVEPPPLVSNPYAGVEEASGRLIAQGVPRNVRKQVLESFEVATIKVRQAGASEYGLRFFDGVTAKARGRYLFESFPASRSSLALDPEWNKMSKLAQWRIKAGATVFEGVASPQGVGLGGGQLQKFIPDLDDLVSP